MILVIILLVLTHVTVKMTKNGVGYQELVYVSVYDDLFCTKCITLNCIPPGKCTVPQSITCNDGALVYPTETAFADIGDVVQYSVPNGYGLIGKNPVCQPNSTWSASPVCLSKWEHLWM